MILSIFSCVCWPFACLWGDVYLRPFAHLKKCFKMYDLSSCLAALGRRCCLRASSGCGEQGPLSRCSAQISHCGDLSCGALARGHVGFSSCSTKAQYLQLLGSRAQAQKLWCTGPDTPQHVESSGPSIEPMSPALVGWIFNHLTTREVLFMFELSFFFFLLEL